MAKPGTIITDAQGTQWRATQGGNWRAESGPNKGKLFNNGKGGEPVAGGGSGGAPAAAAPVVPTPTATPSSQNALTETGNNFLAKVQGDLQQQVAQGLINQTQADQELQRRQASTQGLSPYQQDAQWSLYNQVQSGGINQAQADNELARLQREGRTTAPQTTTTVDENSSVADVTNAVSNQSKLNQVQGNLLTNPNQQGPFGNQTVTIDPNTGQPTVTTNLSEGNQQVLGGIQGSAVKSSDVLQGLLGQGGQFGQFLQGAMPQSGPSQQLQDAIYANLTKNVDREYQRDREQAMQTLADRGIGLGEPGAKEFMQDFEARYDQKRSDAMNQAVQQSYNTSINQQGANTAGLGTMIGGMQTLGGLGQSGMFLPNFQGFQAVPFQQPDIQGLVAQQIQQYLTEKGFDVEQAMQDKQIQAQKDMAKGMGGGGGEESPPRVRSPFGSPPPQS